MGFLRALGGIPESHPSPSSRSSEHGASASVGALFPLVFLTMPGRSREPHVHVHNGEIVVTQPEHGFCAVYAKPTRAPELVLKHRAQTTDSELMFRA